MTDTRDTNPGEARYWLELANGGGVMLRERSVAVPSEPRYQRHRQPKRLEAAAAVPQGKDL